MLEDEGKTDGLPIGCSEEFSAKHRYHRFLLGKELPCVIEQIGSNIDFLILDTVHVMPGEFLDFICALPFLKDRAVVVLHDVSEHCRINNPYGVTVQVFCYAV